MYLSILCVHLFFHAVKASTCTATDGVTCEAKQVLNKDVLPADGMAMELLQRTAAKKLQEEGSVDDHAHHVVPKVQGPVAAQDSQVHYRFVATGHLCEESKDAEDSKPLILAKGANLEACQAACARSDLCTYISFDEELGLCRTYSECANPSNIIQGPSHHFTYKKEKELQLVDTPAGIPNSSNMMEAVEEQATTNYQGSALHNMVVTVMTLFKQRWERFSAHIESKWHKVYMKLNRRIMISTVVICFIFRLTYASSWVQENLLRKSDSKNKKGLKPFSWYVENAMHFTTPPESPTWIYTTSRGYGQGTFMRASIWFLCLVPFVPFVFLIYAFLMSLDISSSSAGLMVGLWQLAWTVLYNVLAPWPSKEPEHKNDPAYLKKIGCIVPCHQSADEIAITVKSLLQFLEPEHIVVVDNGNSVNPLDDTSQKLQELEPRVTYMWVPIGMKTNALWMGLNKLPSTVEYVMHVDDDTALPADMFFDEGVWDHEPTDAISYGINMYQTGLVEKFVDFEFKQFSQMRLWQSNLSTVWFQHGIIGIWRRHAFTEILKEHPFLPFGEDNWNGTINLLKNRQMRQELRSCVTTYAPATLLPVTGCRTQGYGAANLWKQRADRWFVNAPRRFFIRLYLLFFYRHDTYLGSFVFKFISIQHLMGIIIHLVIPLAIVVAMLDAVWGQSVTDATINMKQLVFSLFDRSKSLLVLTWLDALFQNYVCWRHRKDIQVELKVCLLYPFYQTFLMLCCWYGHWRCLFWYLPFVPMRHGYYTDGDMTPEKLKQIHKIDTCPEEGDKDATQVDGAEISEESSKAQEILKKAEQFADILSAQESKSSYESESSTSRIKRQEAAAAAGGGSAR